MKNLSLSFAKAAQPANGVQQPVTPATAAVTAADFIKGKIGVVFRGVSSDCQSVMSANEVKEGVIKTFILKPVWDYSTTPASKTNEQKLNALILMDGTVFSVSLMAHQTHLKTGQTVSVRASNEMFNAGNRSMLSAEILD